MAGRTTRRRSRDRVVRHPQQGRGGFLRGASRCCAVTATPQPRMLSTARQSASFSSSGQSPYPGANRPVRYSPFLHSSARSSSSSASQTCSSRLDASASAAAASAISVSSKRRSKRSTSPPSVAVSASTCPHPARCRSRSRPASGGRKTSRGSVRQTARGTAASNTCRSASASSRPVGASGCQPAAPHITQGSRPVDGRRFWPQHYRRSRTPS